MKVDGLSNAALIKTLSPRVMLSNHFLPKGTKTKVNLEDQSRQKVSFSFAQTKKPLQSPLFTPSSSEKPAVESLAALSQSTPDNGGQCTDSNNEQKQTSIVPKPAPETPQIPLSSATKLKPDLGKMHFKKQILSVSVSEDKPTSVIPEESHSTELQVLPMSASESETKFLTPPLQNIDNVNPSENTYIDSSEIRLSLSLKKSTASSGKDGDTSGTAEVENKISERKTRPDSDGDSAHMSSSRQSDSKSRTNLESKVKDVKKSSSSSHLTDKEKCSSKRSENYERSSSYSKSDRDSRYTSSRSARSDKERRRTRSRSRSRSRGPRTSSSHSRSERSRGDRGSRSERSYYYDSDRRSHRSSPRRERKSSRSRTDRVRDSSDSEEDHRKTRTRTSDSSRSSVYSSSHKESRSSSYSKSDKAYKSIDPSHSSEIDRKSLFLKSERTSKRLSDSDQQRKWSPDLDSSYRKSSIHSKSDSSSKCSFSSIHTHSHTNDKYHKNSSSESEADHKEKSQASERSSVSDEKSKDPLQKNNRLDHKQMTPCSFSLKATGHDRQSDDLSHSPDKTSPCPTIADSYRVDSELFNQLLESKDSCTQNVLEEFSVKKTDETKSGFEVVNKNASTTSSNSLKHLDATLENLNNVKDSLSSNKWPHVNLHEPSCNKSDGAVLIQDKKIVDGLPEPKSLPGKDEPAMDNMYEETKSEMDEPNTLEKEPDTSLPLYGESTHQENMNPNQVTVKKSGGKKSRWDIVGQSSHDSDQSHSTLIAESKTTAIKVISVKQIEVTTDNSQQDFKIRDDIPPETEKYFMLGKHTQISKHECGSDSMSMDYYNTDQNGPNQTRTQTHPCDLEIISSVKTKTNETLHSSDASQVDSTANLTSWDGNNYTEKSANVDNKNYLVERPSAHLDALRGQSEASDSDNSEYDSDCGEAIKRLHSVVVVPKNSSLGLDAQDSGASQRSTNNSGLQSHNFRANIESPNITNQISSQRRPLSPSVLFGGNDSSSSSMLCQSQSNMIDSTSPSEGSSAISVLSHVSDLSSAHRTATDSAHSFGHLGQYRIEQKQHSISNKTEYIYAHHQLRDLSNNDNFSNKNRVITGWGFTQSEQPSSTYQQPDSSHGPQLPITKLSGISPKVQEHEQSNHQWNHQSPHMQTSRTPYLHAHELYRDLVGEIHPDSLTNDHGDCSTDKCSNLGRSSVESREPHTAGSSSSVQGHEISSNSRGSVIPDPPRDVNFRPHRGRGPPKKRRQEFESDSDNEAEAGPAGKKDRHGDVDTTREPAVKAEVFRPSLTLQDFQDALRWKDQAKSKKMPPYFDLIEENLYLTER